MAKRFNKGLVLGKFMPPHDGHLFLINTAAEQCEKVYVLVCSLKNEPINGFLRWSWLQMIYKNQKNIEIIHVTDENPQHPEELIGKTPEGKHIEFFYGWYWVPTVETRVKNLDVVFTSEEYGDEFAYYLGIQHVLVDIDRTTWPVSGTKVRNNPYEQWDYIPHIVKPYFTKRVAILGPESTGKSTLTANLAHHYKFDYIEEYGRLYVETVKKTTELNSDDFYEIAVKHNDDLLNVHSTSVKKMIIADTDALTTKIFGEMYVDGYKDERIDEIIKYQWFDLTLLMDVDVPWIDDGTRDFPNGREDHFKKIKYELDKLGRKYIVISGTYTERFEKAKLEIEKLLG